MIKDRRAKIDEIVNTIKTRIAEINWRYRSGPDLYFYQRITDLRNHSDSIQAFLSSDYQIEMLYATLVSWDMNSRGAKMKYFTEFKANLLSSLRQLGKLEVWERRSNLNSAVSMSILRSVYDSLSLMKSGGGNLFQTPNSCIFYSPTLICRWIEKIPFSISTVTPASHRTNMLKSLSSHLR